MAAAGYAGEAERVVRPLFAFRRKRAEGEAAAQAETAKPKEPAKFRRQER